MLDLRSSGRLRWASVLHPHSGIHCAWAVLTSLPNDCRWDISGKMLKSTLYLKKRLDVGPSTAVNIKGVRSSSSVAHHGGGCWRPHSPLWVRLAGDAPEGEHKGRGRAAERPPQPQTGVPVPHRAEPQGARAFPCASRLAAPLLEPLASLQLLNITDTQDARLRVGYDFTEKSSYVVCAAPRACGCVSPSVAQGQSLCHPCWQELRENHLTLRADSNKNYSVLYDL